MMKLHSSEFSVAHCEVVYLIAKYIPALLIRQIFPYLTSKSPISHEGQYSSCHTHLLIFQIKEGTNIKTLAAWAFCNLPLWLVWLSHKFEAEFPARVMQKEMEPLNYNNRNESKPLKLKVLASMRLAIVDQLIKIGISVVQPFLFPSLASACPNRVKIIFFLNKSRHFLPKDEK